MVWFVKPILYHAANVCNESIRFEFIIIHQNSEVKHNSLPRFNSALKMDYSLPLKSNLQTLL